MYCVAKLWRILNARLNAEELSLYLVSNKMLLKVFGQGQI